MLTSRCQFRKPRNHTRKACLRPLLVENCNLKIRHQRPQAQLSGQSPCWTTFRSAERTMACSLPTVHHDSLVTETAQSSDTPMGNARRHQPQCQVCQVSIYLLASPWRLSWSDDVIFPVPPQEKVQRPGFRRGQQSTPEFMLLSGDSKEHMNLDHIDQIGG